MKLRIKILSGGVKKMILEVPPHTTYERLLELLNINPETVLVLCHGNPVPIDEKVTEGEVEILRIVSGG